MTICPTGSTTPFPFCTSSLDAATQIIIIVQKLNTGYPQDVYETEDSKEGN
jgi:hypothetical protein